MSKFMKDPSASSILWIVISGGASILSICVVAWACFIYHRYHTKLRRHPTFATRRPSLILFILVLLSIHSVSKTLFCLAVVLEFLPTVLARYWILFDFVPRFVGLTRLLLLFYDIRVGIAKRDWTLRRLIHSDGKESCWLRVHPCCGRWWILGSFVLFFSIIQHILLYLDAGKTNPLLTGLIFSQLAVTLILIVACMTYLWTCTPRFADEWKLRSEVSWLALVVALSTPAEYIITHLNPPQVFLVLWMPLSVLIFAVPALLITVRYPVVVLSERTILLKTGETNSNARLRRARLFGGKREDEKVQDFSEPDITLTNPVVGLVSLLNNKYGFDTFVDHLVSELTLNNLLFLVEVCQYAEFLSRTNATLGEQFRDSLIGQFHFENLPRSDCLTGKMGNVDKALQLKTKYIEPTALMSVTLSDACVRKVNWDTSDVVGLLANKTSEDDINTALYELFEEPLGEVLEALLDSLTRFRATSAYKLYQGLVHQNSVSTMGSVRRQSSAKNVPFARSFNSPDARPQLAMAASTSMSLSSPRNPIARTFPSVEEREVRYRRQSTNSSGNSDPHHSSHHIFPNFTNSSSNSYAETLQLPLPPLKKNDSNASGISTATLKSSPSTAPSSPHSSVFSWRPASSESTPNSSRVSSRRASLANTFVSPFGGNTADILNSSSSDEEHHPPTTLHTIHPPVHAYLKTIPSGVSLSDVNSGPQLNPTESEKVRIVIDSVSANLELMDGHLNISSNPTSPRRLNGFADPIPEFEEVADDEEGFVFVQESQ